MPDYEVKIKFHIFPYRKFEITAKDEGEARKIANNQAQQIIDALDFSIASIKRKKYLMDKFL
ncbi:MAG: hypothetical protein ACFE85_06180 [Candidatus Hodarchaeota archaeon]